MSRLVRAFVCFVDDEDAIIVRATSIWRRYLAQGWTDEDTRT